MPVLRHAQAMHMLHTSKQLHNLAISTKQGTFCSPANYNSCASSNGLHKVAIVFLSNRIIYLEKFSGVGRPEGKEIYHLQGSEPPATREFDTAPDGRIVLLFTSGTWIEHDE